MWYRTSCWSAVVVGISLLTIVPLVVILSSLITPDTEVWQHIVRFSLSELLLNTLWLLLGVGAGVLFLGVSLAWLVSLYDFPGRKLFNWALMLPLAIPAYVMAFAQLGIFEFTGPVQLFLRHHFGSHYWFPNVRSTGGVIFVMSLAFYPYVYLLSRNAFSTMGRRALEVGQSLGLSPWQGFWRVALPMARPWIVAGTTLALMETLADFGTVAIFNYDTFTTAIYKAWFSLFSLSAAKQLASLLIILVFILLYLEQRERGKRAYTQPGKGTQLPRSTLTGAARWWATICCSLVLLCAFILPFIQLAFWAWSSWEEDFDHRFLTMALNSFLLSLAAAVLVTFIALLLAYAARSEKNPLIKLISRFATLGYAVPGTVLAVGVFVPVALLDNLLLEHFADYFADYSSIFNGTLLVMFIAYTARFLAVGHSPVNSAMQRITTSQEEAARNMGLNGLKLIARLHLPLLKTGMFTATLMVFVDVMKEMPITLMTRPYGWDTLAVRIFNLTTEGEWQQVGLPAVTIVLVGLLPVILLSRQEGK